MKKTASPQPLRKRTRAASVRAGQKVWPRLCKSPRGSEFAATTWRAMGFNDQGYLHIRHGKRHSWLSPNCIVLTLVSEDPYLS